jgi:hypothetical protein
VYSAATGPSATRRIGSYRILARLKTQKKGNLVQSGVS